MPRLTKIPKIPREAQTVTLDYEARGRYPVDWGNVLEDSETIVEHSFYVSPVKVGVPPLTVVSGLRTPKATVVTVEATVESQYLQSFIVTAGIETSSGGRHFWSFVVDISRVFLTETD